MTRNFADASVLRLLFGDDSARADQAENVIAQGVVVTTQVLEELAQGLRSEAQLGWPTIREILATIRTHCRTVPTHEDLNGAIALAEAHSLSLTQSTLALGALAAGCTYWYSARLSDGQTIGEKLTVRNPFGDSVKTERNTSAALRNKPRDAKQRLALLYARPGFMLRRANQIAVGIFENACAGVGLTGGQLSVLTVVNAHPGIDQATLARAIGFDKVTTSHLVRGLQTRSLITRAAADHRRGVSLQLTADGNELLDRADPFLELAYKQLASALAPREYAQLTELLGRLNERLDSRARAPLRPL
ncbi:marR family protein [Paraburkholderia xenovorans LB400]|uniref:Transcriptional regulator, MarR family n=1 Tax=Paraburkholderia xenovorans (strain LB400) TaxID=266265 RepID=Q13GI0_PARXL|nr:MarR family transcriptional regulator [Paraburkholderia xenovorans]ABE36809.1 transcriptional regulator, MarR family [Paraburkholderia xenovorans LB400]AIP34010.1 marR family protein [Paraburkholderia xenovorans LB400]